MDLKGLTANHNNDVKASRQILRHVDEKQFFGVINVYLLKFSIFIKAS